jgi:hypothetical protein
VAPDRGGQLYELDVRELGVNLLATLARRPEVYHPRPVGADSRLIYDAHPRKCLLDHFYDPQATLDDVLGGDQIECGDFVAGRYRARLRRVSDGVCAQLSRRGTALGHAITVTKQLTLWADNSVVDIRYELAGLPPGRQLRFAVEFNFAGLPAGCPDRYFVDAQGRVLADFGHRLDLTSAASLRLVDRWQGLDVGLSTSASAGFWAYPIQTLSRSQRGLETIHQSVAVLPHWLVVGDAAGHWSVELQLSLSTSAAGSTPVAGWQAPAVAAVPHRQPRQRQESTHFIVDGPHHQLPPKTIGSQQPRRVYEG